MKKLFNLALLGAIALTGAVGFSSCSSSNDEVINNPDYNPETNSVKTSITLSINPANSSAGTRQTDAIVQQGGVNDFRGITNIYVVPSNAAIDASTLSTQKFGLDDFTAFQNSSENYRTYADKDVSVGVTHFLFLGKAKNNAASSTSTPAEKLASGYTTNTFDVAPTTTSTVGGLTVTSGTILTEAGTGSAWETQTTALATYLGTIASATGWAGHSNTSLNSMYNQFTRTTLTAGSANAVLLTLQDLYRKIDELDATTVNAIRAAITATNMAQVKEGTSGNTAVLEWQSSCAFKDFPTSLGLPEGAAHYKYVPADGTNPAKYEYTAANSSGNVTTTPATDFIYPNELYYLTSTPIRTTSTKTVEWPASVTNWQTEANWNTTIWTGNQVVGETKNIALKYNIQYGSARLATQVKCGAETLYDNAIALDIDHPTQNRAIPVNNGTDGSFKLTGVIVGGQPTSVGWNYLPTSDVGLIKALYDRVSGIDVSSTTAYSTANYTLVFDDLRTGDLQNVNVCLEFLNNSGKDFYGKDGLILNGQKFYLVGTLNTTATTTNPIKTESDEALKAYLPSRNIRTFIQDYTTTAKFTITAGTSTGTGEGNVGSLGKALSTVPDLRTSSQEIGLSVDLSWETGLTFEINL